MKKHLRFISIGFGILLIGCFVSGFGGPAPAAEGKGGYGPNIYMIDDFEDGDYTSNPEWWRFDNVNLKVVDNSDYQTGDQTSLNEIKKYSLNVAGTCTDWYCGGMGTYTARKGADFSKYNTFQMDVYGNGVGSGTIKIELYDDDNGNWVIEQDPKKNYAPIYDDLFAYNLIVDWRGWKRVSIPIADFMDENPGVGDDIWNPDQTGGSGGLIQTQIIFVGSQKSGSARLNIDNVSLAVK